MSKAFHIHLDSLRTISIKRLPFARLASALIFVVWLPFAFSQATEEGSSLHGVVRTLNGEAVSNVLVCLRPRNSDQISKTYTDARGMYRFSGLKQDTYTLTAEVADLGSVAAPAIFIGSNESKSADLVLQKSKTAAPGVSSVPQFFDSPQFTVSGVTDTTSLGGHGSDTVVRTRDSLAKETASLASTESQPAPSSDTQISLRQNLQTGNYDQALQQTRALLAKNDKPELHDLLGNIEEKLGNSLDAVHEYQRAAELDPREQYLFDWGSELLLHHAPEPALEVFTDGTGRFPQSVRMRIGLGAAEFAGGSYDDAVQQICRASDLNPDDPTPYLFLGKMLAAQSTISTQALEKLHRFVSVHPLDAQANYYYAIALWKTRRQPQDAAQARQIESLLKNAIRIDPKYAAAYLEIAIVHSDEGNYSQTIADYQQAIQADPALEEAHYRLAQAYRHEGEAEKARAEMQLYSQLAQVSAEKAERERHEIPQFVYTLREPSLPQAP